MRVYQHLERWAGLRFGVLKQTWRLWLIDLEAFSQNFTLFFSTLQPDSQHRVKYQGRFRGVVFFCSSLNSLSQVVERESIYPYTPGSLCHICCSSKMPRWGDYVRLIQLDSDL